MSYEIIDEIKDYGNIFSNNLLTDDFIENKEIISYIEKHINGEHRTLYLKIKNGNKINKVDINKVIEKIKEIMLTYG